MIAKASHPSPLITWPRPPDKPAFKLAWPQQEGGFKPYTPNIFDYIRVYQNPSLPFYRQEEKFPFTPAPTSPHRYHLGFPPQPQNFTYTQANIVPAKPKAISVSTSPPSVFKSNPFNIDHLLASLGVLPKRPQPVNISVNPPSLNSSSDDYYYYDYDIPDRLNATEEEYYDDEDAPPRPPPSKSLSRPPEVKYSSRYRDKPPKMTQRPTTTTAKPSRGPGRQRLTTITTTNRGKTDKKSSHRPKTRYKLINRLRSSFSRRNLKKFNTGLGRACLPL